MSASTVLPPLLALFDCVGDLKMLPRSGWLFAGVPDPESVAEHICGVALFSLFLAETINEEPAAHALAAPLRVERVTALALIHDLAESVLTDLPKRSAVVLGKPTKHEAEERVMDDLLREVARGDRYIALWQEYSAASTPEARLVKDVDKLEMVFQAVRYAARGHRDLSEFWVSHSWYYSICGDLCRTLLHRHQIA